MRADLHLPKFSRPYTNQIRPGAMSVSFIDTCVIIPFGWLWLIEVQSGRRSEDDNRPRKKVFKKTRVQGREFAPTRVFSASCVSGCPTGQATDKGRTWAGQAWTGISVHVRSNPARPRW